MPSFSTLLFLLRELPGYGLFALLGLGLGLTAAYWQWYLPAKRLRVEAEAENGRLCEGILALKRHALPLESQRQIHALQGEVAAAKDQLLGAIATIHERDATIASLKESTSLASPDANGSPSRVAMLEAERDKHAKSARRWEAEAHSLLADLEKQAKHCEDLERQIRTRILDSRENDLASDLAARENDIIALRKELERVQLALSDSQSAAEGVAPRARSEQERCGDDNEVSVQEDPHFGYLYQEAPTHMDDLTQIRGIAKVLEGRLHRSGIYRFKQIARWDDKQVRAFSKKLRLKGRIQRDGWVKQARRLHEEAYGESLT